MPSLTELFRPTPDMSWSIETRTERPEHPMVRKARRQLARNGGYYRQRWLVGLGQQ